jgi:N-formylglutamate amidohydrolase
MHPPRTRLVVWAFMIWIMLRPYSHSLLLLLFTVGTAFAYEAQETVDASKGTLPLILTVPHDGGDFRELVPERKTGVLTRDAGTARLAQSVASILQAHTGKRPYLVIARFSRKYLDANRAEREAMESEGARPAYRAYHDQIAAYVDEVRSRYPSGSLMIDIHGQSQDPDTTFRGTRAGLTTKALIGRHGQDAIQGENSILGLLAAKGYAVNPPIDRLSLDEDLRYSAGFTVVQYGSQKASGIDAIQLEFGKNHRARERLAQDFAEALLVFMTHYGLLKS